LFDPAIYRTSLATLRFASPFSGEKISRRRQNLFHSRVRSPPLQEKNAFRRRVPARRAPTRLDRAAPVATTRALRRAAGPTLSVSACHFSLAFARRASKVTKEFRSTPSGGTVIGGEIPR
jgi:hypothetical protein